jgi:hypothetical protein
LLAVSRAASPDQIHVAIEVPHGPVVETLIERSFKVHAINPKQMDRFRDRFTLAEAKDDSRDAEVMASALRTDRVASRLLAVLDPAVIELRELSGIASDLGAERNRLTNRPAGPHNASPFAKNPKTSTPASAPPRASFRRFVFSPMTVAMRIRAGCKGEGGTVLFTAGITGELWQLDLGRPAPAGGVSPDVAPPVS